MQDLELFTVRLGVAEVLCKTQDLPGTMGAVVVTGHLWFKEEAEGVWLR